jgi:hypothetical protein
VVAMMPCGVKVFVYFLYRRRGSVQKVRYSYGRAALVLWWWRSGETIERNRVALTAADAVGALCSMDNDTTTTSTSSTIATVNIRLLLLPDSPPRYVSIRPQLPHEQSKIKHWFYNLLLKR